MTFPIEGHGLNVVTESETVLAAAGVFDLILQAVELALVGIQFPIADKGIVGPERAGADEAEKRDEYWHAWTDECCHIRICESSGLFGKEENRG